MTMTFTILLAVLATITLIAAWFLKRALTVAVRDLRGKWSKLEAENTQLRANLAEAENGRAMVTEALNHWKASAADWRREALNTRAAHAALLERLAERLAPTIDPDDTTSPTSVAQADRRAAEARRAKEERSAVQTRDPAMRPTPRATVADDDEDDIDLGPDL